MIIVERNPITITKLPMLKLGAPHHQHITKWIGMSPRMGMDVEHFVADLTWVVKTDIRMLNKAGERISPYFTPFTD